MPYSFDPPGSEIGSKGLDVQRQSPYTPARPGSLLLWVGEFLHSRPQAKAGLHLMRLPSLQFECHLQSGVFPCE